MSYIDKYACMYNMEKRGGGTLTEADGCAVVGRVDVGKDVGMSPQCPIVSQASVHDVPSVDSGR
jgi:hypothetical protein